MILKSFGCSFIFGLDLPDDGRSLLKATPSKLTWPALLAQDRGWEYQCHAKPGSGNLRIAETVLQHATELTECVFVVGWSWIDRFDYNHDKTTDWSTVMPIHTDSRAESYFKYLHSQYRDMLTNLMYIDLVRRTLEEKHIPYLMTYQDDLLFENQWYRTGAVGELQDNIHRVMTEFEGDTFLNFSKKKGYPISPELHPLAEAQKAAFELIKDYNFSYTK